MLQNDIKSKLLSYQIKHTESLINSLKKYNRALDASDTGTGKTYSAIAICKALNLKPLIICPKSVIKSWQDCLKYFDCDYYGVSNYELIQNCKYYTKATVNERINCPYVKRTKVEKEIKPKAKAKTNKGGPYIKNGQISDNTTPKIQITYVYTWNFPPDLIVIFDEAHRCKNKTTNTSSILFTMSQKTNKILLLSATIADKPETFEVCGYVLGLYVSLKNAKYWIQNAGKSSNNSSLENCMKGVHDKLYPEYASRMRIKDLGNLFPDNEVKCECLDMSCAKEIQEQYKIIQEAVEELKKQEEQSFALGALVKARMRIEQLKIPTFLKLTREYLAKGCAVAIFTNFTGTLRCLAEELKTNCLIFGEQHIDDRNKNIEMFNNDQSQIIICNIAAGGVGISLHDLNGKYPRISIISPSWSAQNLLQALGRIHRAKGKTKTCQKIIYCKNTVEEGVCERMKEKIENIGALNDGNLDSYQIQGLIDNTYIGNDSHLSEFEKVFQQINTLNYKKIRLMEELKETEDEIKTLVLVLNNLY